MLVEPTLQTPDSVFLRLVMTLAAGGDGACHKYFLRGMVHKTKHKSPLNFGVDEWQGVERLSTTAQMSELRHAVLSLTSC